MKDMNKLHRKELINYWLKNFLKAFPIAVFLGMLVFASVISPINLIDYALAIIAIVLTSSIIYSTYKAMKYYPANNLNKKTESIDKARIKEPKLEQDLDKTVIYNQELEILENILNCWNYLEDVDKTIIKIKIKKLRLLRLNAKKSSDAKNLDKINTEMADIWEYLSKIEKKALILSRKKGRKNER